MNATDRPKLLFQEPFDERTAFEVSQKGWCGIGIVELPGGERVRVFFYDPARLAQDLETDVKAGDPFIAEPGMIVIPSVTREYMNEAVSRLYDKGYFKSFIPLSK